MKQDLSSLMDGELDEPASLKCMQAMDADPELKALWHDYHLIGDAIRGSAMLSLDVRAPVGAALQQEPTVLAPRPATRMKRGAVRYAMAASVALAGVVGWYVWQAQPVPAPGLVAQAVPTPKTAVVTVADRASNRDSYLQAHQDMMVTEGFDRVSLGAPAAGVAH